MSIRPVLMPKWGLAMEEGTVVEWLIGEGSEVSSGAELVEIETSKITNVMEAQQDGPLRRHVAPVGETLPVGALIGVIAPADVSDADIDAFITDFQANFVVEAKEAEAAGPEEVEVGGIRVVYEETGAGDGLPVVMVHGFGGDRNNWLFNASAIGEDRRVIMMDLPGHGQSDKTVADASLEGMAKVVLAAADALGLDKYHLMGHSMGGAICLKAAQLDADKVASLMLICPAGLADTVGGDFVEEFITAERRKGMKQAAQLLFADKDLITRDLVNDLLKFKRLDGVQEALEAIRDGALADADKLDIDVASLGMPIAAIIGEKDEVIPPGADIPATVDVETHPVGHMAHMEAAAAVNKKASALFASAD